MRKALGALVALATLSVASPSEAYTMAQSRAAVNNAIVLNAIRSASERHGIPLHTMYGFGRIESGLDPRKRTGSYKGLFQLSDKEFRAHGGRGSVYDADQNADAFARLTLVNMARFRSQYGRNPTGSELYLMHQQGPAGAAAHMRNPNAPAWVNMANTGEGRRKGPGWAKKAIWGNMTPEWKRRYGRVENVRSADFMNAWKDKYHAKAQWKAGTTVTSADKSVPAIPTRMRADLDRGDKKRNFRMAQANLKLNKRETRLYERHLNNLHGTGGVDDGLGGRSTLMAATVGVDGRHYVIPLVWDGKILNEDAALKRARKEGLARFPSYSTAAKAEARYYKMHEFMDMDGEQYATQQAALRRGPRAEPVPVHAPATGPSELDTVSAEMAPTEVPEAPPTLASVLGTPEVPEPSTPGVPAVPVERSAILSRRKRKDPATSDNNEEFMNRERLNDVFGQPFGDLYKRPPQEASLPPMPLLRDLFRAA